MRLLLVFDPPSGLILAEREFADADRTASVAARLGAESAHPGAEVVVLSAASRADMERTHSRYFTAAGGGAR
jgi:hypothetical protein